MKKLNEEDFIKLANKIYINPSKETLNSLKIEYELINQRLDRLKLINVDNVEPLTRIAKPINFLRDDEIDQSIILDKKIALKNAKEKNEDFIVIKRIIK